MVLHSPLMFMRKAGGNARQEKLHMILSVTANLSGVVFEFIPLKYVLLSLSIRIMFCGPSLDLQ